MGTTPEVHSIFLEGHTFLVRNHRQASLEISPITFLTAQTVLTNLKYEQEKNSVAKSMKPESTAFPMLFNAVKGG